jgi:ABC-type antimicrobial peptide transport system permease subunit
MGVRLALGARPSQVRRLALSQGMVPVAAGLIIGFAASLATGRLIAGLLYAVSPTDPLTFAVTISAFGAVAALAAWIPATRATRVDPVIALRSQ